MAESPVSWGWVRCWKPISTKGDPAVNRVCSIFSQLLQLFPRLEFEQRVRQHRAERHAQASPAGAIHCHAVLSARLGARAARDLRGLGQVRGQAATSRLARGPQAFHLGLRQPTSTLGTVSERLPATLSALPELGERAMALSLPLPPAVTRQHHDRSLCLALRLGAAYKRTQRAVKLHLLLDHQGYLPSVS